MNKLIKKMFTNRGISNPKEYMNEIDRDEHGLLKRIDGLAAALYNIHLANKHIVVLPDFDMDGIMSGVVGFAGLSVLGFRVSLFIPDPKDGYEFTPATIDRLISEYPDVDVIITCDVGVACVNGISYAIDKGVEVLVTDHHTQSEDSKRNNRASVIVDPMCTDESYEHPQICGAYVFYQCLYYLADKYYSSSELDYIRNLRVFAGIGTISDSMPLLYENRQLVRDAVDMCRLLFMDDALFVSDMRFANDNYKHAFLGLYEAIKIFVDMGTVSHISDITEEFFGFYLAPMFNSVKRLNGDMRKAFGVFFGYNRQACVEYLYELNVKRKTLVETELQSILDTHQPYAPYIYISDASSGVLGLLATKLLSINGVPTVVVRKDGKKYTGSGRSLPWFPFLSKVLSEGFYVAGHELAFGIGISDSRELKSLYAYLDKEVGDILASAPDVVNPDVVPDFVIALDATGDTDIDLELFEEYISELDYYRPFGQGFPSPVITLKFRADEGVWQTLGSTKQHLKITLPRQFPVLCFNQAEYNSYADTDVTVYVTGHLVINRFRDVKSVNFIGDIERIEA